MPFGIRGPLARFQKKTNVFLRLANFLLLAVSWFLAIYSYPRLPRHVPISLRLFGRAIIESEKSPWFFLYPLVQTLFVIAFLYRAGHAPLGRSRLGDSRSGAGDEGFEEALRDLRKEWLFLTLIFINLIFIHLQTSLILLAHHIGHGVNEFYFFSLIAVLVILIPYYRIRRNFLVKGRG
jgi:hypothetical protein